MTDVCEGVVDCTALVLAEGCAELEGRLTLFGVLDEIRPDSNGDTSFVVYAKFEGCEHVFGEEKQVRLLITDEDGDVLTESEEYAVRLDGEEGAASVVANFDLPEDLSDDSEDGDRLLWVEAELDRQTLSQTAIPIRQRYSV
jgi:hypothetical protein